MEQLLNTFLLHIFALYCFAIGVDSLRHWRQRRPMVLSFWQGGLAQRGKVIGLGALPYLAALSFLATLAWSLWLLNVIPFEVGKWTTVALTGVLGVLQFVVTKPPEHFATELATPVAVAKEQPRG